jgi:quercetin dioxygenase-like cupin family protein
MKITRIGIETGRGPSEWFTGAVYHLDTVATPSNGPRLSASSVHFTPSARTAWHPSKRTDDLGHRRRRPHAASKWLDRGDPRRRPGLLRAGEEHWHGAAQNRFMTHIAMLEVGDDGAPATWGVHVTDEEYAAAPPIDEPTERR